MGNNNQRIVPGAVYVLKNVNQVIKAPEVDSRFRLIKNGKGCVSGNNCGNFNSFQLSAGKAGVNISVDVISGA